MGKIIVLVSPVFFVLIAIEWWWAARRAKAAGTSTHTLSDAIASLTLGVVSQLVALFTGLLRVGIYAAALALIWGGGGGEWATRLADFWRTPLGWVLALVFYDLCYYWHHRLGHTAAVLWAGHAVHHSSPHYNLTTALRQTSTAAPLGWIFYLPMAFAGVPLEVYVVVALINLIYQFWVHTEFVGKLGWFDRWFCSPSNHRVHHAVNDAYVDKNFGGIFMVWDHVFGSYADEIDAEPCVYGTRKPLTRVGPVWANVVGYAELWAGMRAMPRWQDKLASWLKPPGWQPEGSPVQPVFSLARAKSDPQRLPQLDKRAAIVAGLGFVLWLQLSTPVLYFAGVWPISATVAGAGACVIGFCATAAFVEQRIGTLSVALWHLGALAGGIASYLAVGVPARQMLLYLQQQTQ